MFRIFAKLFGKQERVPEARFVDKILGQFEFDRGLGWKRRIQLDVREVELVLGSDGEPPSAEMLETAKSWVDEWSAQRPKIMEYIRDQLQLHDWSDEPSLPNPESLELDSINILWPLKPKRTLLYFYPDQDLRSWHVTLDGFQPQALAYDH